MPLTPLSGPLGVKRAAHLLRRACTGASINDIETYAALTAQEAFDRLVRDDLPTPPEPVDRAGNTWISEGPILEDVDYMGMVNAWMLGQMMSPGVDEAQKLSYAFRERIIFFFHTHFTTKKSKVRDSRDIYYQNALFRHYAFDRDDNVVEVENPDPDSPDPLPPITYPVNFKQLTKKISVENAMLIFLDGRQNLAGNPNENYARELLELYSIGRGLEGNVPQGDFEGDYVHYTEQDVQEGAKILSGFEEDDTFSNIDEETGLPRGVIRGDVTATQHENSVKTLSSRMGGAQVTPDPELLLGTQPTEESILDEISQWIDIIFDQPETAKHVGRKLYRFFIYHEITEEVQNGMVQDIADVFVSNDFKLIPTLEALFTSQEFYEGNAGVGDDFFGSIIKSPLDLAVGFARNFNVPIPDPIENYDYFYDLIGNMMSAMGGQGMNYYEPFEVAGYSAYHQFPIYNRSWIATNYLTNRYDFIRNRISTGDVMEPGDVNPYAFVSENVPDAVARDARQLVTTLAGYFLPLSSNLDFNGGADSELTVERLEYFLDTFLGAMDSDPEAAWTAGWDAADRDIDKIDNQLANLFNAMLQSPEYQLM